MLLSLVACTERRQEALLQSAEERLAQNQYAEASDLLRKVIQLNPESHAALTAIDKLGFTLETYLRDWEGALFSYQEFIRLSQDKMAVYEVQKRVANIYFEQHRNPEKAISAYRKLASLSPDSLEGDLFQFRIAQAYFRQNNFEQARIEFQHLIDQYKKSQYVAHSRFEIGNAYYMDGKYDIAEEALKEVERRHPQSERGPWRRC